MQLAYLSEIFNKMNTLNTLLQGGNNNIVELHDKLKMFVRKFEQWQSKMENLNEDLFSTLKQFIESNIIPINDNEKFRILNHLSSLKSQFENYF
jgi:hypothetical protein